VRRAGWAAAVTVLLLVAAPEVAHACPVCFDPKAENRIAFLATTIFMTALPLAMVGAVVSWLRRRSRLVEEGPADEAGRSGMER
jgi:hypothetical protein